MGPGTLIASKYLLERLLGEGAMGQVWAATHVVTGKAFAVKIVTPALAESVQLRERMVTEAKAAGRITHRNVVEVYDVGEEHGAPYLVMQLLTGESLEQVLDRGPFDPETAVDLASHVARGLAAAHAVGVVHRDLKPANVFLHQDADRGGQVVKLLDFGVSKVLSAGDSSGTVTGLAIGSPAYMSPEQARGDHRGIDGRTDVWSLGVLLFEMISGQRPFEGTTAYDTVAEILKGEIPHLSDRVPGLDPRIDAFVFRCLQRDRERRPSTAGVAAAELDDICAREEPTKLFVAIRPESRGVSSPQIGHGTASSTVTPAMTSTPAASAAFAVSLRRHRTAAIAVVVAAVGTVTVAALVIHAVGSPAIPSDQRDAASPVASPAASPAPALPPEKDGRAATSASAQVSAAAPTVAPPVSEASVSRPKEKPKAPERPQPPPPSTPAKPKSGLTMPADPG